MNVIYFSADWCGPCKMFKPTLQQVSQQMGIQVNYINVDYDAALIHKYNIKSVPTLVITGQDGSEWFRHTGVMGNQQLVEVFNRFR